MRAFLPVAFASLVSASVAVPLEAEPRVETSSRRAIRKEAPTATTPAPSPPSVRTTLVQLHTNERVVLGDHEPAPARFAELLSDRTTGEKILLDPRLLDLLRALAARTPTARIELVSGYRSPKLNERLRKKGHNVASHSQHSLGHAVDFRLYTDAEGEPVTVFVLEKMIRDLGWEGGVGIYPGKTDRFVHADVGPNRRWLGK